MSRLPGLVVIIALLGSAGCRPDRDKAPAATDPEQAAPPKIPPMPGNFPASGGDPSLVTLTVNILSTTDHSIQAMGSQGVIRLVPEKGTVADLLGRFPHAPGTTLRFICRASTGDERTAINALPHQGLPISYGRLVSLGETEVVLESPLGRKAYARNAWSEIPATVKEGGWVGLKHYGIDDQRTILNILPLPGEIVELGVIRRVEPGPPRVLHITTVKGERSVPVPVGEALEVGQSIEIHRTPTSPPEQTRAFAVDKPFLFIGKFATRDIGGGATFIDAWGDSFGFIELDMAGPDVLADSIVAGDLVEVDYRVPLEGRSVAVEIRERELSPVYFGNILSFQPDEVMLLTRQHQQKTLVVTPETFIPVPIEKGDLADVGYVRGSNPETARFIVKE